MSERAPSPRSPLRRFFREHVRPYLGLQVEIGVCLLLGVVLELADPLVLKAIVDRALGDADRGLLVLLVAVLAGVLVFRVAFRMVSVYLYSYSGLRILFDLRQRAFEHVQRLSPYFFRGERAGDILARLTSDVDVLQRAAAHTVVNAVHDVLVLVGIGGLLLWLDPLLTACLALVYPVLALLLARTNRGLRREGLAAREAVGDVYDFVEERLGGVRLVQEFGREGEQARRHVRVSRPWIRSNLRLSVLGSAQVSLADLMSTGAFVLVFLLGGMRALSGALSLGSLIAYYTLATRLYRPISGLIDINVDLQVARASLARVYELLDREPAVRERPGARLPSAATGALRLEGVAHTFEDGTRVLRGVDLRVAPGEFVALVGPSGGGKSTLAALIGRTLDPDQGRVVVDGLDARDWKLRALRRAVGVVPQETELFHDSLAANLRLARPDASDDELLDALESVELADLASGLPDGLDTPVGQRGLRLSGGERQRLALARALLAEPRILVLDEATSALDASTERAVMESLRKRHPGTLVVIAHRLPAVRRADRIAVVAGGRIVEEGTHAELVATGGLYRELWTAQEEERAAGDAPPPRDASAAPPAERTPGG